MIIKYQDHVYGKGAVQGYSVKLNYCVKVIMILHKEPEQNDQVAPYWLSMETKLSILRAELH